MEKIGLLERFKISILDIHSYKKLMKSTIGKAICFMLLVTLIFEGIPLINSTRIIMKGKSEIVDFVKDINLDIMVSDGQLSKPEVPIDTTLMDTKIYINKDVTYEEARKGELSNVKNFIGLFNDRIVVSLDGNPTEMQYSLLNNFSANANDIIANINFGINVAMIIVAIIILVSSFIGYLVKGFIIGAIASITAMFKRKLIPFGELYKCGIHALVLPIIFCSIIKLIGLPIFPGYLYYIQVIAAGIYAAMAIINYEPDVKEEVL